MTPGRLPSWFGGTYIGNALRACRKVLVEREEGDKMIVLITDGYSADLAGGADEEIARKLEADGIVVMTVHAAEGDIPEEVARIAAQTGGEAFKTDNPAALESCFAKIDSMVKSRMVKAQAEAADDYRQWSFAGLVALALALLAALGLRANPW
jgi:Ca-activated chloride channel family protein